LTAEAIDEDGWLRVGDLAILHNNGAIEIIERVDELKKLQNGQYIAPQKIEAIYINVPLID
jgi:long-chain acyl-CoA synthetase